MSEAAERGEAWGRVVEIWRYPVKSMLGERLETAEVTARGLIGDRAYAMVDIETGKAVSAKNPRRWPNLFEFQASYDQEPSATEITPARIKFPDGVERGTEAPGIEDCLSSTVGRPVKLALSSQLKEDLLGEGYWPDHEWLAERDRTFDVDLAPGTFFDGAMFHLVTTASLEHLHSISPGSRFDVRRYRPNLLIETPPGLSGIVENGWIGKTLMIGGARLRIDRSCPRCVMTTLPQGDLPKDPNVLRTVVQNNSGNLGVYATVLNPGRITKGDRVFDV